ncbi:MAG TPA: hypothetical protein VJ805_13260 [Nitrospiraceae bacterium]|nr:hypothetical protein [Nitrospiraceae bacterium]
MTREEFFMYLTIGLIVIAPVVARLYRRATLKRTTRMLHDEFGSGRGAEPSGHASPRQER